MYIPVRSKTVTEELRTIAQTTEQLVQIWFVANLVPARLVSKKRPNGQNTIQIVCSKAVHVNSILYPVMVTTWIIDLSLIAAVRLTDNAVLQMSNLHQPCPLHRQFLQSHLRQSRQYRQVVEMAARQPGSLLVF